MQEHGHQALHHQGLHVSWEETIRKEFIWKKIASFTDLDMQKENSDYEHVAKATLETTNVEIHLADKFEKTKTSWNKKKTKKQKGN